MKKMYLKKYVGLVAVLVMLLTCALAAAEETRTMPVVFDHVMDAGVYTELDYEHAIQFFSERYDGWNGACSAAAKITENGDMIVARNMDFYINRKPAYIVHTNVEGCYPTVGLSFSNVNGPDYEEAVSQGVPASFAELIPFMSTDVMNSEGLYIEMNMRVPEPVDDPEKEYGCSGTNPQSETRLCAWQLPLYVAEHCKDIDEMLAYLETLDIYTMNKGKSPWNFCFIVADATGRYGLMEIARNKIFWLDGQPVQTNFYVTPELAADEKYHVGIGRYEMLMDNLDACKTAEEMRALLDKAHYSKSYSRDCAFDPRSEKISEKPEWTTEYVLDEANRAEIEESLRSDEARIAGMSREEIMDMNCFWETTFSVTANCTQSALKVSFFEDAERTTDLFPTVR